MPLATMTTQPPIATSPPDVRSLAQLDGPRPATSTTTPPATRRDRLTAILARSVQHRLIRGPILQRVGEPKAGFTAEGTAPPEMVKLLAQAFAEIRARRAKTKDDFQEQVRKAANPRSLMGQYAATLQIGDWANELEKTTPFAASGGQLALDGTRTKVVKRGTTEVVATLTRGAAMFEERPNPDGDRKTYLNKTPSEQSRGRIYVDDDRDVKTRQLAYMEKSIYQFMHFVQDHPMTGRFQLLHGEIGVNASPTSVREKLKKKVFARASGTTMTLEQLAVLHQYKGSGPEQRGLSLTSTPREAIYSNEGTLFATEDGVRMTIDLAKVPKAVKLVNQYAHGGVKDLRSYRPEGSYDYTASVTKNRELYLEKLDPAWVVSARPRKIDVSAQTTALTGAPLVKRVGELLALSDYLAGYRAALSPASTSPATPTWVYAAGKAGGGHYKTGYEKGKAYRETLPDAPTAEAVWQALNVAYGGPGIAKARLPDDYWIGWIHGAWGKAFGAHLPPVTVTSNH